tara:strand:- start:217 stop:498 length:282 start_codon:yes stop_codon:yes gene_type:complete
MNKLKGFLPIIAFVFAAFAAFAFSSPEKPNDPRYGKVGSDVYDVTDLDMGPLPNQYWCDEETTVCLFEDEEASIPVDDSEGTFIPGSSLTPIQ